jgi:serine/threonine-protein kinase RsbW
MAEVDEVRRMKTRSGVPVELRVAAEFEQLPVVRAVAETLAVLGDFTLDDVADIKLAVDEVCSELIAAAPGSADLTCSFAVTETGLHVTISAPLTRGGVPNRESFGWHVLETLMNAVSVSEGPVGNGSVERTVAVELVKYRGTI